MAIDRTLLLIEDDDITREVLTALLEADGWKLEAAASGEDALCMLQNTVAPPAVILTDQQLPGIAGHALALKLREILEQRKLRAVLLGMSASVTEAPGFDAILRKPFPVSDVSATCERLHSAPQVVTGHLGSRMVDGELPVLDREVVLRLEEQMGPRARELYGFALTDAAERLRRMSDALGSDAREDFRREAHALKGSCGMIGARKLSGLAAHAEKVTSSSQYLSECHQYVSQMHTACDEVRLMLETLFPA